MLGRGISHALLQAVAGLDEPALRAAFDRLADAELLFVEASRRRQIIASSTR